MTLTSLPKQRRENTPKTGKKTQDKQTGPR